jgi:aspartyl/asparaginyl beta-hydroxylase (cupin superfamily)
MNTSSDVLIHEALTALQAKQPAKAKPLLEQALAAGADNAGTWLALAMACRDTDDHTAGHRAADASLNRNPGSPHALLVKADIYMQEGDRRAAAAYYRDALQAAPKANQSASLQRELARAQHTVQKLNAEFEATLEHLLASHSNREETTRLQHSLDVMMGRRKLYFPQPRQFYFPDLPVREFYDPADFDWVPALEAQTQAIRKEAEALLREGAHFGAYLKGDADRPSHDFHGMKDNEEWGALYLWQNGEDVPENQARCPAATAAMRQIPLVFSGKRSPNVLFSRLKPGATIPPHTGMVNTRLIGHLPLIVPDNCGFRVGGTTQLWREGKVWLFDDTIEHEAWNESAQERIILLFEVWKPELTEAEQGLITQVFNTIDAY